jgi:hypothetical protein
MRRQKREVERAREGQLGAKNPAALLKAVRSRKPMGNPRASETFPRG